MNYSRSILKKNLLGEAFEILQNHWLHPYLDSLFLVWHNIPLFYDIPEALLGKPLVLSGRVSSDSAQRANKDRGTLYFSRVREFIRVAKDIAMHLILHLNLNQYTMKILKQKYNLYTYVCILKLLYFMSS